MNEIKSLILVGLELKPNEIENDDDLVTYGIKGLIIDLESKKIIGEKKF